MTELKSEIKEALQGKYIQISSFPFSKEIQFKDTVLRNTVNINFGLTIQPCILCTNNCTDYCWNCEEPLCNDHRYILYVSRVMTSICLNCKNLLIQSGEIKGGI